MVHNRFKINPKHYLTTPKRSATPPPLEGGYPPTRGVPCCRTAAKRGGRGFGVLGKREGESGGERERGKVPCLILLLLHGLLHLHPPFSRVFAGFSLRMK